MSKKLDLSQIVSDKARHIAEGYSRRLREGRLTSEEKKRHEERLAKFQQESEYTDRTGIIRVTEHH